jgi:hypothetical protein
VSQRILASLLFVELGKRELGFHGEKLGFHGSGVSVAGSVLYVHDIYSLSMHCYTFLIFDSECVMDNHSEPRKQSSLN